MNSKVALITGITGQDGSYLAELLLGGVDAVAPEDLESREEDDAPGAAHLRSSRTVSGARAAPSSCSRSRRD